MSLHVRHAKYIAVKKATYFQCFLHPCAKNYHEALGCSINSNIQLQEPINRSLHMHCILESTFARIFLFLELPFLQEAQFHRENLSQSSSLEEFPNLPAITVTFRRDHFMWGKHAALFWLGILNSARECSHLQCSKNKKIRAKVDSEGLYGRGRLLFMCSWQLTSTYQIILSANLIASPLPT